MGITSIQPTKDKVETVKVEGAAVRPKTAEKSVNSKPPVAPKEGNILIIEILINVV